MAERRDSQRVDGKDVQLELRMVDL